MPLEKLIREQDLTFDDNSPNKLSHNSSHGVVSGKHNGREIFYKRNKPLFAQMEAAYGEIYRLLLGEQAPEIVCVEKNGEIIGTVSYRLSKFAPFQKLISIEKIQHIGASSIPGTKGLASILLASYVMEEEDLHGGNFGVMIGADGEHIWCKIDHDRSMWSSVTHRFLGARWEFLGAVASQKFPVIPMDIENFPDISYADPYYWPTKERIFAWQRYSRDDQIFFKNLKNNKEFAQEKWQFLLRVSLISRKAVEDVVGKHFSARQSELSGQIVEHFMARQQSLRVSLPALSGFRNFMKTYINHEKIADSTDEIAEINDSCLLFEAGNDEFDEDALVEKIKSDAEISRKIRQRISLGIITSEAAVDRINPVFYGAKLSSKNLKKAKSVYFSDHILSPLSDVLTRLEILEKSKLLCDVLGVFKKKLENSIDSHLKFNIMVSYSDLYLSVAGQTVRMIGQCFDKKGCELFDEEDLNELAKELKTHQSFKKIEYIMAKFALQSELRKLPQNLIHMKQPMEDFITSLNELADYNINVHAKTTALLLARDVLRDQSMVNIERCKLFANHPVFTLSKVGKIAGNLLLGIAGLAALTALIVATTGVAALPIASAIAANSLLVSSILSVFFAGVSIISSLYVTHESVAAFRQYEIRSKMGFFASKLPISGANEDHSNELRNSPVFNI